MPERPGISLEEWFPLVAGFVPTPVTKIIRARADLLPLADSEGDEELGAAFEEICAQIVKAGNDIGWPIFLRTGLTSAKHEWKHTCHVPSKDVVARHVSNIICASATADLMGLPCDVWVVREMLATRPSFHAFDGLPITKERRFFIRDGEVIGWQPYWPFEAFETEGAQPDIKEWREALFSLNKTYNPDEIRGLTQMSIRVASKVPGAWSVDWLNVPGRGWYLTDMAWLERSYIWKEWPNAPKEDVLEAIMASVEEESDPTGGEAAPEAPAEAQDRTPRRTRTRASTGTRVRGKAT